MGTALRAGMWTRCHISPLAYACGETHPQEHLRVRSLACTWGVSSGVELFVVRRLSWSVSATCIARHT